MSNNNKCNNKDNNDISENRQKKVENFKLDIDKSKENTDNTIVYNKSDISSFINNSSNKIGEGSLDKLTQSDKERIKDKSKKNKWLFRMIWISMVVLISIVFAKYILVGINDMLAIGQPEDVVSVAIPKNASISQITNILEENDLISDPSFFKLYWRLTKSSKRAVHGSFDLRKNMDYEAIITHIQRQSNRTDTVKITFIEGINVLQCAKLLQEKGVCSSKEFLEVCNSNVFDDKYDFISSINNADDRYYKLEGYLFPDTYTFYLDEDPQNTIQRFLDNYKNKITKQKTVSGYDTKVSIEDIAKKSGMDINEVLILASLIQAEASNNDDMYRVSSVFHNRMKVKDKNKYGEYGLSYLSADSTVWYPYRTRSEVPSDLVNSFSSKYDTYKIQGLPDGPICNPGMSAIDAALHPSTTDYYYFCHSSSGTAYYAKTINEHKQNLKKAGLA